MSEYEGEAAEAPPGGEQEGASSGSSGGSLCSVDRLTLASSSSNSTHTTRSTDETTHSAAQELEQSGWQSRYFSPTERLNALLRHAAHSDLTVSFPATGKAYKVHRLILAMSSPVLESMVFGPHQHSRLELDDVCPQAFKWLLANMYMGCSNLRYVELAAQVLVLAFNYEMHAVCAYCKEYLLRHVNTGNCHFAYHSAMVCGDATLAAKCAQIASGAWSQGRSVCVEALSRPALRHLLSQDRLCMASESALYQALVEWGRKQLPDGTVAAGAEVRVVVDDLLPLIRFLAMTPEQFIDKVSSSRVLTADECVAILMNIRGLRTHPLPSSFRCSERGQRETVFDDSLLQVLTSCPHQPKKKSDLGESHGKYFRQGIGFKLYFSTSININRIQISSGFLPRDAQFMLLDSDGKHMSKVINGEFLGHQCICGKGQNPHSNHVSWKFEPPFPLQGKREYIGKVRHSNSDSQVENIKETLQGITVSGQITASPYKIDFFLK